MLSKAKICLTAYLTMCLPGMVFAENVEVRLAPHETFVLAVNQDDSIALIKKNIEEITGQPVENQIIQVNLSQKGQLGYRNYNDAMSSSEQKDLYFIMKTLALKSLLELAKYKSKLEKAGDRIDHVHPLNFLAAIFSDEEMKAYLHAIKKRGSWVWDKFIGGLSNTLDEEYKLNNMNADIVRDFANRFGLDHATVQVAIDSRDWSNFVKFLINSLPRETDADRYDI